MKKLFPAVLSVLFLAACSGNNDVAVNEKVDEGKQVQVQPAEAVSMLCAGSAPQVAENFTTTASGLQYQDLKVGSGAVAESGQMVVVDYVGTLKDGTKFDSSCGPDPARGEPFVFELGAGDVIKGWDEGVAGMKIGGIRRLVIPAELGYGSRSGGSIPADSTLLFDVEFLEIIESAVGE